jgi:hypothetical protein
MCSNNAVHEAARLVGTRIPRRHPRYLEPRPAATRLHAATRRANGRGSDAIQGHSTSVANHRLANMFRSLPRSDSLGADGICSKSVPIGKPFLNTMFAAETTLELDEYEHAFLEP